MGILDVKVIANDVNNIDIEMQVTKSEYVAERILWYWAKLYAQSIDKGEGYNSTKKAICILIADFELERLKYIRKYHTKWNIREEEHKNIILTDKFELHIIELAKLEKKGSVTIKEKELLEWCKFIDSPEDVEESIMEGNAHIRKAKEELDKISQDKKERRLAELREKEIMDEMAIRASGYKEGKEEGINEGKKIEKIEIAKAMINKGITIDVISEITGLDTDSVNKLIGVN